MSNPLRGEADLGNKKIVVNFNSLCTAEAALGMKVPAILSAIETEGLGFDDVRRLLKALLTDGSTMTLEQVGDFVGEVGLEAVGESLVTALTGFFPKLDKDAADHPPKAE